MNPSYRPGLAARFPSSPAADVFPKPDPITLTARTVFTAYELPPAPGQFAPAGHLALCCCGQVWCADTGALLRKTLGSHSCAQQCGRVELVPIDDQPSAETIERLLAGLRGMQ